jgi:hypothetical protein
MVCVMAMNAGWRLASMLTSMKDCCVRKAEIAECRDLQAWRESADKLTSSKAVAGQTA